MIHIWVKPSVLHKSADLVYTGRCRFVRKYDRFWDLMDTGKDYKSQIIENPNWRDVLYCANEMIPIVSDFHHRFLEGIKVLATSEEEGITYLEIRVGS